MSEEAHAALLRRWWEGLNAGTAAELIDEVYAPDYVLHDPSEPAPVQGREGVRAFIADITAAFPEARVTLEDLVAAGDRVVQRATFHGTHRGEFQGIAATGKTVSVWVIVISRMADGQVAEEWQLVDTLGLLQQLGAIPAS